MEIQTKRGDVSVAWKIRMNFFFFLFAPGKSPREVTFKVNNACWSEILRHATERKNTPLRQRHRKRGKVNFNLPVNCHRKKYNRRHCRGYFCCRLPPLLRDEWIESGVENILFKHVSIHEKRTDELGRERKHPSNKADSFKLWSSAVLSSPLTRMNPSTEKKRKKSPTFFHQLSSPTGTKC